MPGSEVVYYCSTDHFPLAAVAKAPVACEKCGRQMTKIGWMETDEQRQEEAPTD